MSRRVRVVGTIVLTAAAVAYLVWKLELRTTLDVLGDASLAWFTLSAAIMLLTIPVLALLLCLVFLATATPQNLVAGAIALVAGGAIYYFRRAPGARGPRP